MIVRFSVIVPVYNVNKYVTECVESIVCQEGGTFEVILVVGLPYICDREADKEVYKRPFM